MKKFIPLLLAFLLPTVSWGQISEGFEGATFPPLGWSVAHDAGATDWTQISSNARSGTKCTSSLNPSAGANKSLILNLSLSSSASALDYYVSVSSLTTGTGATLKIYAGTTLLNMTLMRTLDLESLAAANTYYQYTDYLDGNTNQSGNTIDLRNTSGVYIKWVHNKTSGTAASCRIDDVSILNATALPVELTSFRSNVIGKKVELKWQTATEVNNYGFEIERASSATDTNWVKIGFVQGYGNSNSPKNYSFTDEPMGGKEFKYRLKQIDFDGKFEYLDDITASFQNVTNFELEQNHPNPFNPSTKISYTIPVRSNVKLRVYNMLAQLESELVNESQEAGHYQVIFNGSNLPSGTYFYKLEAGKFIEVKKFILVK